MNEILVTEPGTPPLTSVDDLSGGRVFVRREAQKRGLVGNVEQIASERIGRETVTYVSDIYKYYVPYRLVVEENERRAAAKESIASGKDK